MDEPVSKIYLLKENINNIYEYNNLYKYYIYKIHDSTPAHE